MYTFRHWKSSVTKSIPVGCVPPAWKPYMSPVSVATTRCRFQGGVVGAVWTGLSYDHQMSLIVWCGGPHVWCRFPVWYSVGRTRVGPQVWGPGRGHPTMWPIPWCIWCYLPPPGHRRLWKQYLLATSFAGGHYLWKKWVRLINTTKLIQTPVVWEVLNCSCLFF